MLQCYHEDRFFHLLGSCVTAAKQLLSSQLLHQKLAKEMWVPKGKNSQPPWHNFQPATSFIITLANR